MKSWEIVHNRRVIFGNGKLSEIPGILTWYQKKKVFLVVSKSVRSNGVSVRDELCRMLDSVGIGYYLYNEVSGEPDLHVINKGRDLFVEQGCD